MKKLLFFTLVVFLFSIGTVSAQQDGFASSSKDMLRMLTDDGGKVYLKIEFKVNSSEISPKALPVVNALGETLKAAPEMKVKLIGHTDSTGDAEHNLMLSLERALSVKLYPVGTYELDPARIKEDGMGEKNPIAPNNTPQGRAVNRRVEVINITPVGGTNETSGKSDDTKGGNLLDTKSLWD